MTPKTTPDTTITDIHRTRERMAEKFNGNIEAILEDARNRQAASGRPVWKGAASDSKSSDHDATIVAPKM
jgi:hypothetical protein